MYFLWPLSHTWLSISLEILWATKLRIFAILCLPKSFLILCQLEIAYKAILKSLWCLNKQFIIVLLSHFSHVHYLWPHGLYSLPGSSVHRIPQARLLDWVARPRRSSWSRYQTCISLFSALVGRFFTAVSSGKPLRYKCYSNYVLQPESWILSLP